MPTAAGFSIAPFSFVKQKPLISVMTWRVTEVAVFILFTSNCLR
jgi:hypothetical protein